jgi:single-strand DNA-binding protein
MNKIQNRVKLIGHLGSDPEIRTLDSGRKVAIFRVATNSSYTNDKGERVEDTQWHPIVACGKLAEISEKKSQKVKNLLWKVSWCTAPTKSKTLKNAISR